MALGWGLIGTGKHADKYILPAIKQSASSKLVGICHYDKQKADFFAKRYEAERSYTSIEEMLADPDIQVVDVATPETMHKEQVIKCAEAGKHVRCEFPMALSVEDCREMLDACNRNKVKIATGFAWAQHPAHMEMKRRIANGDLGEINFIEGQYNFIWGGGLRGGQTYWKIPIQPSIVQNQAWKNNPEYLRISAIFHQGIAIQVLRFLLGKEVTEVTAFADPKGEKKCIACLKFEGDIYGFAVGSHNWPYGSRTVTVYGTEGRMTGVNTLAWDSSGKLELLKLKGNDLRKDMRGTDKSTTRDGLYFEGQKMTESLEYCGANMWVDTIEAFNKSIIEDTPVIPSGIDGLRERQISLAIFESSNTGRAVKITG